ncbi:2522_t:CDS:2 [Funneliformis mosseae]|uniref:2522_t:CDS:1 n=1 Tax=Funneliformis mosseae TaxID=27381 RepID=A0A9N9BL17_FUNMO|nr:2522_t:CDS:2 [Funneliformis mosseae]
MQSALDASHKENESIQNDLDCSYEENERMQKSMNQMIPLANKLNAQKALLDEGAEAKDSDTTQSLKIRVKELKNELEQVTQDSSFKDGLIFCLRSRVSNLEDELNQIASHQASHNSKKGSAEIDSDLSSNDYKHDEVVEKEVIVIL